MGERRKGWILLWKICSGQVGRYCVFDFRLCQLQDEAAETCAWRLKRCGDGFKFLNGPASYTMQYVNYLKHCNYHGKDRRYGDSAKL